MKSMLMNLLKQLGYGHQHYRLSNLDTYYMEIVDGSDIDGLEVKGRKTQMGSWVRLDDVRRLIEELKNDL